MCENVKRPHMFTTCEWVCSNEAKYNEANNARKSAQNTDYDCDALLNDIKKRTVRTMQDVDMKLG